MQQVPEGMQAQFFTQQLAPLRSYTLQVLDGIG